MLAQWAGTSKTLATEPYQACSLGSNECGAYSEECYKEGLDKKKVMRMWRRKMVFLSQGTSKAGRWVGTRQEDTVR